MANEEEVGGVLLLELELLELFGGVQVFVDFRGRGGGMECKAVERERSRRRKYFCACERI